MSLIDVSGLVWHVVAVAIVVCCFVAGLVLLVREARLQVRAFRIMHRPKRGRYVPDEATRAFMEDRRL